LSTNHICPTPHGPQLYIIFKNFDREYLSQGIFSCFMAKIYERNIHFKFTVNWTVLEKNYLYGFEELEKQHLGCKIAGNT